MVNPAITTSMRTIIQRAETGREPRPSANRREEIWSAFSALGGQASYTVSHSPFVWCFHFYKMLLLVVLLYAKELTVKLQLSTFCALQTIFCRVTVIVFANHAVIGKVWLAVITHQRIIHKVWTKSCTDRKYWIIKRHWQNWTKITSSLILRPHDANLMRSCGHHYWI